VKEHVRALGVALLVVLATSAGACSRGARRDIESRAPGPGMDPQIYAAALDTLRHTLGLPNDSVLAVLPVTYWSPFATATGISSTPLGAITPYLIFAAKDVGQPVRLVALDSVLRHGGTFSQPFVAFGPIDLLGYDEADFRALAYGAQRGQTEYHLRVHWSRGGWHLFSAWVEWRG